MKSIKAVEANKILASFYGEDNLVNFSSMVFARKRKRLSIIGKYAFNEENRLKFIDAKLNTRDDYDKYYLGLSTSFTNEEIVKLVSGYCSGLYNLQEIVSYCGNRFMLPINENKEFATKSVIPLCAFTIVRLAYHYGIKILISNEIKEELKKVLNEFDYLKGIIYTYDETKNVL